MTTRRSLLAAALTVAAGAGLTGGASPLLAHPSSRCHTATGAVAGQNRKVGDFQRIELRGAIDAELIQGTSTALRLDAQSDVLPLIESRIEKGALILEMKTCLDSSKPIRARITYRDLGGVGIHGSGDVTSASRMKRDRFGIAIHGSGDVRLDVDVNHLAVDIRGSGDVQLTGRAANAQLAIAGSGDIRAPRVAARKASVQINGSGNVDIQVTEELDAQVNGSGDVVYRGNPKRVQKQANGSGSIRAG